MLTDVRNLDFPAASLMAFETDKVPLFLKLN